jgi:peptidoglycan L-alanyl-D-glutamate endopeptidase CwlK
MGFFLGARSLAKLRGVHPDLVAVVNRAIAITAIDFVVIEGLRTFARQQELVAAGASKTMKSRHLTGHAVDIAPVVGATVRWDWPLFHQLAPYISKAASDCGVDIEWGGDWKTFKDGPHWQLPWSTYP